MSPKPKISIIIPVYNSEEYLPMALDSLVEQTYRNLEIIIINNGSSGNVASIFDEYKNTWKEFKWELLSLNENVGWFNAIIKGLQIMTGDYFTEMDSDDTVSVEYYYQLIKKAIEQEADVVTAEYVHKLDNENFIHCPMNDTELDDFIFEKEEILTKYFEQRGRNYNCCTMWSKLFARSVWNKSKPYLVEIKERITNCADVLINCILLGQAEKWVNIHGVKYYHTVSANSGTVRVSTSVEEMKFGFDCTYNAFKYMKVYLLQKSRFDELKDLYTLFRNKYIALMFAPILTKGQFSASDKLKLSAYGCSLFGIKKPIPLNTSDCLFENRVSPYNNQMESIRKLILDSNTEIISFDIFDTLIERPFLHPDDTLDFLSIEYNNISKNKKYIEFATYRRNAQRIKYEKVRKETPFYYEITLDEIYQELMDEGVLTENEAAYLKKKEIELEDRFCNIKKIGKYFYDLAIRTGKKIICVSDMYLSKDTISNILEKNGYTNISKIYISSSERVCKNDGKLFKKVLADLQCVPNKILHIGDNIESDYHIPKKLGIKSAYMPAAREVFMGKVPSQYTGQSFRTIIGSDYDPINFTGFLGNRCLAGLMANKIFINPFVTFNYESDFDSSPNIIGYYLIGSYIFSVAKWILENARKNNYHTIHFFARDGLIFKRAYDLLVSNSKEPAPRSNYLHVSRQSLFPLLIKEKKDIYSIKNLYDIDSLTPKSFLQMMKPVIADNVFADAMAILQNNHIVADLNFDTDEQWTEFTKVYLSYFFDKDCINKYRSMLKCAFKEIIGPNDCSFDVGYSARSEMLISEVLDVHLDACYLFYQRERAIFQSQKVGIKISVYHDYPLSYENIPAVEQLISSTEDGCIGYHFNKEKIIYLRKKNEKSIEEKYLINYMHNRAVEFVKDFITTFPEWEKLPFRFGDRPFVYYCRHASAFDKGVLSGITLSDPLCRLDENTDITSLWHTTPFVGTGAEIANIGVIGLKGALVNYIKKHIPKSLYPFAKKIKNLIKW